MKINTSAPQTPAHHKHHKHQRTTENSMEVAFPYCPASHSNFPFSIFNFNFALMSMMNFDDFKELIASNRSIRRFDNSRKISPDTLSSLVELTRFCASGRNLQPLRYRIIAGAEECNALFPLLKWAGYYSWWEGPAAEERPAAYLVQCLDTDLTQNPMADEGIQLEAITLGAASMGIGACIIKAFNGEGLREILDLPANMKPCHVIALGYPAEKAQIVDIKDGDYKYFRNEADVQCVPKRSLSELIIKK